MIDRSAVSAFVKVQTIAALSAVAAESKVSAPVAALSVAVPPAPIPVQGVADAARVKPAVAASVIVVATPATERLLAALDTAVPATVVVTGVAGKPLVPV